MSVDERVRSSLNAAADRVDGDPAGVETIRRRAVRRHRARRAGWATAVVVLVAGFVAFSRPLQPSVDLAVALTPSEILADRVVTEEEWETAGAAVVQCLTNQGLEAEFDPDKGSFDVIGDNSESSFEECWGTYMGVSVQRVWADQQYDPAAGFEFYRDVVECTESRTGADYGDMTQDPLGFASTEALRTINRALEEAPDVYDSCFDDVIRSERQPSAPRSIVEEVVSSSEADAFFVVGLNRNEEVCAESGYGFQTRSVCGGEEIAASVLQGDQLVILAGYTPLTAARLTAVFNGEVRRPLELVSIPGHDLVAFGTIETIEARYVEIEVVNDEGEVIQRFFPSIGQPTD